jgi:hypothetical protein
MLRIFASLLIASLLGVGIAAHANPCAVPILMGFSDEEGNAFIELPLGKTACDARARLIAAHRSLARPGQPLYMNTLPAGAAREPAASPACLKALSVLAEGTGKILTNSFDRFAVIPREAALDGKSELKGACWYATHAPRKAGQPVAAHEVRAEEAQWLIAFPGQPPAAIHAVPDTWQQFDGPPERLPADAPMRAWLLAGAVQSRVGARYWAGIEVVTLQRFEARVSPGRGPEPLTLIGTISQTDGPYRTWTAIVRGSGVPAHAPVEILFDSGVQQQGGYIGQVAGVFTMPATAGPNAVDALVLRARHYEGGSYRVLTPSATGQTSGAQGAVGLREIFSSVYSGN